MAITNALRRVASDQDIFANLDPEVLRRVQFDKLPINNPAIPDAQPIPQRTVAPITETAPLPGGWDGKAEYEAAHPSIVPPTRVDTSDMGTPPSFIKTNNKGRPLSVAVGPGDLVERNQELLRAQEDYQAPRSTKDQILSFLTGGIPGGVAYATDQRTRNDWANGRDVAETRGKIDEELGIQGKQASAAAAQYRPVYQQQQIDAREEAEQRRREQGDRRLDQGDMRVDQGGRRVDIAETDAQNRQPVEVDIDGQKFKVPPPVAARIKAQSAEGTANRAARSTEGAANRQNRLTVAHLMADAMGKRTDKEIRAMASRLGDPEEMYTAAQETMDEANKAEQDARALPEGHPSKQTLLASVPKLREAARRLREAAGKAKSARGNAGGQTAPAKPVKDPLGLFN